MSRPARLTAALLALALAASLPGCAGYQQFASGYDRTYSVRYIDPAGRDLTTSVRLQPIPTPAPR